MTDDERIVAALVEEVGAIDTPMELGLRPQSAFVLVGVVQLALRYPDLPASSRDAGERFVAAVRDYFSGCPTVQAVIDRGNDPAYDKPRTRP